MIFNVLGQFQNHWFRWGGVAKNDFSGMSKNCSFALMTTYAQHSLNMASQKKPLVLANIDNFALEASIRPHMNRWRQHVCAAKINKCASWNFRNPHGKLKSDKSNMHLTLHTATQSENHYFFFDWQKHQNQWKCIVISISYGLWKVLFCNNAKNEPQNGISKTSIKPAQYCSFAPRGLKMALSRF